MTSRLNAAADTKIFIHEAPSQPVGKSVFEEDSALSKPSNLYERKDVTLAVGGAVSLALSQIMQRSNPALAVSLFIPALIASIYQECVAYQAVPSSAPITKAFSHPIVQIFGVSLIGLISPLAGKALAAAQFVGVAKNSVPKLYTALTNSEEKKIDRIKGAALHVFNLVTQGYFTKGKFDSIDFVEKVKNDFNAEWEKQTGGSGGSGGGSGGGTGGFTEAGCTTKPDSFFAKMKPLERLTSPELNPKCPGDAAKIMQVKIDPKCESEITKGWDGQVPDSVKAACASTCQAIKKSFRLLGLAAHPDKAGPKAQDAFTNLANARDTLNARFACKA